MDKDTLVPLLTGPNFPQWVRRMGSYLLDKDLDDVVGFDLRTFAPKPSAPTLSDDDIKRDRRAKAKIEMRLSDTILIMAQKANTSYELWKSIHSTFQRKSMSALVAALKAFVSTTKHSTQDITDYIATMQSNAVAVMNAGVAVDEKLIVAMCLANVPDQYDDVVTALDTLDEVSLEKATAMLLNAEVSRASKFEKRIAANNTESLQSEVQALRAQVNDLRQTHGQCTCSNPKHRHPGGDDACYDVHPELRPIRKRNTHQGKRSVC